MLNDEKPIIIVKKRGHHGGHHGGAWKVAYADFVTAMMAFFLVMWILGLSEDKRQAIAAYFNDPTGVLKTYAGGTAPLNASRESPRGQPAILPPSKSILKEAESSAFRVAKANLEKMINSLPEFKAFKKAVEIQLTPEGLRIELMEGPESMFFQTGSAEMKPGTGELLRAIGGELRKLPNSVVLEGHTDSRPYPGGNAGYSNWELSSDRANSARRAIFATLRPGQITGVRGYADRHLRKQGDPLHFSNRRISILVEYSPQARAESREEAGPIRPEPIDLQGGGHGSSSSGHH